jgi:polyphosphate kinase 2
MGNKGKRSANGGTRSDRPAKLPLGVYEENLQRLQRELVRMQGWVRHAGLKVCVLFEGRDAAGKGGTTPTEKERTQWYFQRYVAHLPSAGEIVLFDRSWYNRAGVERVMGFCTEEEHTEFLRSAPQFERMLIHSGIVLVKYWFSVSDAEQERRFQERIDRPDKRWKLSPMDLESRARWTDYSRAKDEMFRFTDTKWSPWWVVPSDDKRRARLNCITHLLRQIPYEDVTSAPTELPPRGPDDYIRPPFEEQTLVPQHF